jgi:DNA-binding Xre family transcriptional regulator
LAGATIIKQLLIERKMNIKQLSEKMNISHQSMRNKLHRDTFTYKEMLEIADILNSDIEIITRDTKKSFK